MSKLLNTKQVMERLNVSQDQALNLMKSGKIKYVRVGPKTFRAYEDSVEKFIKENTSDSKNSV